MRVLRIAQGGCCLALLAGCGGGTDPVSPPPPPPPPAAPAPVASVTVSPGPAVALVSGSTVQLSATPRDAQGTALSGGTVIWSSSAETVASVSTGGLVTGAAAGSAQIRATSEGKSGEITVTVTPVPVTSVALSTVAATLVPLQPLQLTATPQDAQGNPLAGRAVTWSSSAGGLPPSTRLAW